jgi:CDP-glucose 4,6-dehydratase
MRLVQHVLGQYRQRKVLVTGHTGFKGAWLVHWLHRAGADLRGYALDPESTSLYAQMNGDRICASQIADIRDAATLENTLREFQPDYIFHLAAQSLVGESYKQPLATFDINVMGTANILQAARELPKPTSIVVVTTDKVYENKEREEPYCETDRLGGHDPYSSSKACAELVVESYRKSFFPPSEFSRHQTAIATARSGNVIGGGDWNKGHLMPDIVRALTGDETVILRNPTAVRPWQHVLEPLWGYLLLGARLGSDPARYSGAWNFGSRPIDAITVESLVKRCIDVWGSGAYAIERDEHAPHEANLLRLDSSRAEHELRWQPALALDEAIRITLDWYRRSLDESRGPSMLLDNDIDRFQDRLDTLTTDEKA